MKIIVTIKQVPDTNEVKLDPKTGTLIREGVPCIINPEDKNALEAALRVKDTIKDTEVVVITMGPPQANTALREALAMGADKAILISDRAFAGADTLATAYVLSRAVHKIKDYDLIICGRQAIDGDTAQVGPQLAECLKIPQVTYVDSFKLEGKDLLARSNFGSIIKTVNVKLPALLTVIKEINKPRYKTMNGILKACRDKTIITWSKQDLEVNEKRLGLNGSPTMVKKTFTPTHLRDAKVFEGDHIEAMENMLNYMTDKNLISH